MIALGVFFASVKNPRFALRAARLVKESTASFSAQKNMRKNMIYSLLVLAVIISTTTISLQGSRLEKLEQRISELEDMIDRVSPHKS